MVDSNETVDSGEFLERTRGVVCPFCGLEVTGGFNTCPNDGTRLIPDPGADSALSDRYDSLELIGEGGMSAIYKARHKLMKRTVAIKLLHSQFHNNPDTIRRFQQEAEAISSLSHDNVVNVFDFGQLQHGQPYMVMNYVPGKSMSQVIKEEGPQELSRCLNLFCQISSGLEHAHKKHIVHRDLKPTNVMLTKDDNGLERAVIVDFGIAKIMAEGEQTVADLTKTGSVIGSPYYMSPEQCLGKSIDWRSDIYSFGCLMYETLVGKPVFSGNNSLETMNKHINEKAPLVQEFKGNQLYKPYVQAIIHHAIEKEPGNRYQTISELEHDLSLLNSALQSGRVPKLSELKAYSRQNLKKSISLAAVAIGVVLCLTQMCFWWFQPESSRPVLKQQKVTDDASLAKLAAKNPAAGELVASGITSHGLGEIVQFRSLQKLTLKECTANDTALAALSKLPMLEDLTLKDSKVDDKGMAALGKITSLKKLFVVPTSMTDAGFSSLSKLKNLRDLTVQNIKVLGPGVRQLAELPHLTGLYLQADSAAEIHDNALATISESLPNLTTLKLESTQLTNEGLSCLKRLPKLKRLSLSFSPEVTDNGMIPIAALNLKWLNLNGTEVSDEGLKTLSQMKGLEQIFFWHTYVTDAGMKYLGKISTLHVLHLTLTAVSDAGLADLLALHELRDLKLRGTKVTDDGLKLLKKFPQLSRLSLQDLHISDEGIKALADMPALTDLDLSGTAVSAEGLAPLAQIKTLRNVYLKDCPNITLSNLEEVKKLLSACQIEISQPMPSRALD